MISSNYHKDKSFTLSYKVRSHIFNRELSIKNRFGMVNVVTYKKPFNPADAGYAWLDIELVVENLYEQQINPEIVTNSLDKHILTEIMKEIERVKKVNPIDLFPDHLDEKILVNILLTEELVNYQGKGFQSDALGMTIEFRDEAYPGFYKEEELVGLTKEHIEKTQGGALPNHTLTRSYQLIDNNNRIGRLWINLPGGPTELLPTKSFNKAEGLYICDSRGSKQTVIRLEDLNKDTMIEHGLSYYKSDMENTPHTKIYAELNKKIKEYKKQVDDLKEQKDKLEKTIEKQQHEAIIKEYGHIKKDIEGVYERTAYKTDKATIQLQKSMLENELKLLKSHKPNNTLVNNVNTFSTCIQSVVKTISMCMSLFACI